MAALPSPQYPSRVLHVTVPDAMTQLGHQSAARATGQESKEASMALTPERINELKEQAVSAWRAAGFEPMLQVFVAHAIETEVRKQDDALIQQPEELRLAAHITAGCEKGGQHGTESST